MVAGFGVEKNVESCGQILVIQGPCSGSKASVADGGWKSKYAGQTGYHDPCADVMEVTKNLDRTWFHAKKAHGRIRVNNNTLKVYSINFGYA